MTKRLLTTVMLLFALLSTLLFATSCESEEFLYHEETYPITCYRTNSNCHTAYTEPNTRSEQAMSLSGDIEVYVLDTMMQGREMWVEIQVPHYDFGWVRSNQLTPYDSTKTDRVLNTPTEVMEAAEQPIAGKFAEFYEYTHSLYDSSDILIWLNIAIILLVWLEFLVIYTTETAGRWWEYLFMFAAGITVLVAYFTSNLFEDGYSLDIWWLDLIFTVLAIALPVAYFTNTMVLLDVAIEDVFDEPDQWTKFHIITSVVGFIVFAACFLWWKSVLDWVIIGNAAVQGIILLILLIKCIIRRSFLAFFWYTICFAMMVIPAIIMSCISFVMIATIVAMFIMFVGPASERRSRKKVIGYDIMDSFGNKIDSTDEYGHSSQTGNDYTV